MDSERWKREREERIRARLPNFRSLSLFNEYVACCSVVVVTFLVVLAGLPAVTVQQDAPILIHNNRERKKTTKQREELNSAYIRAGAVTDDSRRLGADERFMAGTTIVIANAPYPPLLLLFLFLIRLLLFSLFQFLSPCPWWWHLNSRIRYFSSSSSCVCPNDQTIWLYLRWAEKTPRITQRTTPENDVIDWFWGSSRPPPLPPTHFTMYVCT